MAVTNLHRLQAASIDDRCRNVRYRQKQLEALYNGIRSKAVALRAAITKDSHGPSTEVEAELCMAIATIQHFHNTLDFDKFLKEEYLVVAGKDSLERRTALGIIAIRPSQHTRLYSILAAIAPAVAAGNCVILELLDSPLEVDAILKELLPQALDPEIFFISTNELSDEELASSTLVDQTGSTSSAASISSSNARTVAIVDRTADIDAAAQAIVGARFRFQGASLYAPDLVIVNEFVKKDFLEASLKYASKHFAMQDGSRKEGLSGKRQETQKMIQEVERLGHLSTFGSSNFMVADISNRNAAFTKAKITGPYLPVVSCTSLTDAVGFSQSTDTTFLAAYLFGRPEAANFLSRNLNSYISWINQIPSHLLIGPAAPSNYASNPIHRYDTNMFSAPRVQCIEPAASESLPGMISKLLEDPNRATVEQIRSRPISALKTQKQAAGHAIGFFEQGIMIGMGMVALSVVLPVVGFGTYFIRRKGFV